MKSIGIKYLSDSLRNCCNLSDLIGGQFFSRLQLIGKYWEQPESTGGRSRSCSRACLLSTVIDTNYLFRSTPLVSADVGRGKSQGWKESTGRLILTVPQLKCTKSHKCTRTGWVDRCHRSYPAWMPPSLPAVLIKQGLNSIEAGGSQQSKSWHKEM